VPPNPNQIYDSPRPNRNLRLPCPERNAHPGRGKGNRRREREPQKLKRGAAEERLRGGRSVPAMERCHPSEVYELFVRHMNTPR
jgi:hypothetical protein